jgi:CxxC motif-containing protein
MKKTDYIGRCFLFALLLFMQLGLVGQTVNTKPVDFESLSQYFENPALLLNYEDTEAIPLSLYTNREREIQIEWNKQEDLIRTSVKHSVRRGKIRYLGIDTLEITPYTWRWIHLRVHSEDKSKIEIKLRRPNSWIAQNGLEQIGSTLNLDLPALDFYGEAEVIAVYPNTFDTRLQIHDDNNAYRYRPITGYYTKSNAEVDRYEFSNGDILKATKDHVIWSQQQDRWVSIGELAINEKVLTAANKEVFLKSKTQVSSLETVYNIEIYREHNYFVGKEGILVHNSSLGGVLKKMFPSDKQLKAFIKKLKDNGAWRTMVKNTDELTPFGKKIAALNKTQKERFLRDIADNPALAKAMAKDPKLLRSWKSLSKHPELRKNAQFLENIKGCDNAVLKQLDELDGDLLKKLDIDLRSVSNGPQLKKLLKSTADLDVWKLLKDDPAHAFELSKLGVSPWIKWSKANFFKVVTKRGKDFESLVTGLLKTKEPFKTFHEKGFKHLKQIYMRGQSDVMIADDLLVKAARDSRGRRYLKAVINDSKLSSKSPWTPNQKSQLIDVFKKNPNKKYIEFEVRTVSSKLPADSPVKTGDIIRIYRDDVYKTISNGSDEFGETIKLF